MHRSALALLLLAFAVFAAPTEKAQYKLERSVDGAAWEVRASFVVTRVEPSSSPKLKVTSTEADDLKKSHPEVKATDSLSYRVVDVSSDKVAASATSTVCALLRGFDPLSSKSLKLNERVGVVVGDGVNVAGLQLSFPTNLHHASLPATDCDGSVIGLFPEVIAEMTVNLVKPVDPKIVTKFEDGPSSGAPAPPAPKKEEKGKEDSSKGNAQEDNRSFFEKYWLYIVMFGVWTLINGALAPKGGAAAAGAADKKQK